LILIKKKLSWIRNKQERKVETTKNVRN